MTNITLSIEEEIYKKMRKYSEIKWSEFVRKIIFNRIKQLERLDSDLRYHKNSMVLADERLLAEDWLSPEDNLAWKDL